MATIGLQYLVLDDNFPGYPNPNLGKPTDGWDNTVDCCQTVPAYPVGTKIQHYNDGTVNPGYYVMAYLGRCDGSFAADHSGAIGVLADGSVGNLVCAPYEGTCADGNETYVPWYIVTGDCTSSDATHDGRHVAIACGSMATTDNSNDGVRYGWFWVGGVAPCNSSHSDVTWLMEISMTTTTGEISDNGHIFLADDGTNGIEFDGTGSAAEQYPCGWAIKADG